MNDDFLHRLRKEPRPQFAARLQARLRRQALSPPPPRVPSRARTLLTLLLLGGAAFAITAMVMRGVPSPLVALYRHASAWIAAERRPASAHRADGSGIAEWLQWGRSWASAPHGVARGDSTHAATTATRGAGSRGTAGGTSAGSAPVGGAPFGSPVIRVLTSWAAYPHVEDVASRAQGAHIQISIGNPGVWRDWPQTMCNHRPNGPDMAFTFEPVGMVSARPCAAPVIRIHVGDVAVVLARSPIYGSLNLTRREVFLALAKWVPDPRRPGTVRENGATTWRQIDSAQGPEPIQVMGPPLSSDLGRAMISLLMEGGCKTYPWIAALESTAPDKYARICRSVRTDGAYTVVPYLGGQELLGEPNALGIIGFADLTKNPSDRSLAVSRVDGVAATRQDIENGTYPASLGIYAYASRSQPFDVTFFFPFQYSDGEIVALPEPLREAMINEAREFLRW